MAVLNNKASIAYKFNNVDFSVNSNISTFAVVNTTLLAVKSNLPTFGNTGTVVAFTIVLTNQDLLVSATNVILTDDLTTAGFTYVAGTAKVNNVLAVGVPQTGITVGTILPLGIATVTFNATVN